MEGQKVSHEAESASLTFNFLAGNQEAEENKALEKTTSRIQDGHVRMAHVPQRWSRE